MRRTFLACVLALLAFAPPRVVHADIALGQVGPDFTKAALGGGSVTLSASRGKVVVLFLLGYGCPFCLSNGPSVEQDLWQYYRAADSSQVVVLGIDEWNGTLAQMNAYQQQTGATFPLLLNGALAAGGNVSTLYGTYDNFIVLNKQGIVRYHAALQWPHGNRYHLDEIRSCVDSLVTHVADAGPTASAGLALSASPNPSVNGTGIDLSLPSDARSADVRVFDSGGRAVADLWRGPLGAGRHHFTWDGREAGGSRVAAGLYFVTVRAGGALRAARVLVLR